MRVIFDVQRFDDGGRDFHTGRRVNPPAAERRRCDCCGLPLVKGYTTSIGTMGEDCYLIAREAQSAASLEQLSARYSRMDWQLRPRIARFLAEQVFVQEVASHAA